MRDATKKAARKGKTMLTEGFDGLVAVAHAAETVVQSPPETIRLGIGRSPSHYDESSVKPVWDELNSES